MGAAQSVTFTYEGVPFTVVYRFVAAEGKDPWQILEEAIVTWDVVDEEGAPVPISRAGFAALPDDFTRLMVRQLSAHLRVRSGLDNPRG